MTVNQVAQRTILAQLSQAWRALTSAQRAGWASLGQQMVTTDSLGQAGNMTGLQAFTSLNRNLTYAGSATISDAPALAQPAPLVTMTATATAS